MTTVKKGKVKIVGGVAYGEGSTLPGSKAAESDDEGGDDLSSLKVDDLRARAVDARIEGAETMKKAELIKALEK